MGVVAGNNKSLILVMLSGGQCNVPSLYPHNAKHLPLPMAHTLLLASTYINTFKLVLVVLYNLRYFASYIYSFIEALHAFFSLDSFRGHRCDQN